MLGILATVCGRLRRIGTRPAWTRTMPYSKGDVILVRFPFADLTEYKKRPALVIQSEAVATGLEQWLVAKITSNLDRTGDSRVLVGKDSAEGHEMGLLTDSVI